MVDQQVSLADDLEDVAARGEARLGGRMEDRVPEGRHVGRRQTEQIRRVQQSGYLENVVLRERRIGRFLVAVEFREQHLADRVGKLRRHLEPDHRAEAPVPQVLLDRAEEIFGLVVIHLEVGVPGDAKWRTTQNFDPGEQRLDIGAD
jgi:hypothetical protein